MSRLLPCGPPIAALITASDRVKLHLPTWPLLTYKPGAAQTSKRASIEKKAQRAVDARSFVLHSEVPNVLFLGSFPIQGLPRFVNSVSPGHIREGSTNTCSGDTIFAKANHQQIRSRLVAVIRAGPESVCA
ncbi:hypothetical protein TNCV_2658061 [Trichonephila clavipes]|nr:hypothetical protein TNCV_2658061 [Trichonephila clavipes]